MLNNTKKELKQITSLFGITFISFFQKNVDLFTRYLT